MAGKISAAPTPVMARIAIRAVARVDQRRRRAADAEQDEPEGEVRRRPKRSPRLPAESSSPANTTV